MIGDVLVVPGSSCATCLDEPERLLAHRARRQQVARRGTPAARGRRDPPGTVRTDRCSPPGSATPCGVCARTVSVDELATLPPGRGPADRRRLGSADRLRGHRGGTLQMWVTDGTMAGTRLVTNDDSQIDGFLEPNSPRPATRARLVQPRYRPGRAGASRCLESDAGRPNSAGWKPAPRWRDLPRTSFRERRLRQVRHRHLPLVHRRNDRRHARDRPRRARRDGRSDVDHHPRRGGEWLYLGIRARDPEVDLWRLRASEAELASAATSDVVEFYRASRDTYFLTGLPNEIAPLDSGQMPGWARTGRGFVAYAPYAGGDSRTRSVASTACPPPASTRTSIRPTLRSAT